MNDIAIFRQLVTLDGDKLTTDSRKVARDFDKHHKNVLRAYDNLKCSAEFDRLNFEPSEYIDKQSKSDLATI